MSAAIVNSHRIRSIWAPPSTPPGPLRPHGTLSVTSTPSSTRCWRNWRPWRQMAPPLRAETAIGRSGAAQGDHGDLVRVLLRHAVAGDWSTVRHSVRHAVHAVRPLAPSWPVAPPAQPLDPGLAACRTGAFSQALRSTVTGLAEPADWHFPGEGGPCPVRFMRWHPLAHA